MFEKNLNFSKYRILYLFNLSTFLSKISRKNSQVSKLSIKRIKTIRINLEKDNDMFD